LNTIHNLYLTAASLELWCHLKLVSRVLDS
jgi:hypothetical protein